MQREQLHAHYQELEKSFVKLLTLLTETFSDSEVKSVQDFIDHAEYGIALEMLAGIVEEEQKSISIEVRDQILAMAQSMGMDQSEFKIMLEGRVKDR